MRLVDPAQNLRHVVPAFAALEPEGLQSCMYASQEIFAIIQRLDMIAAGERGAIAIKNLKCIAH